MILLDAAITGTPAATAAVSQQVELSLWDLCLKGGPLMIVLAILSIVSIYIFVERAIVVNRAAREDDSFMKRIRDYIHEGEIESAFNLCKKNGSPYSRLIAKGISRIGRPVNDILAAVENTGNIEIANLSKGLPWLATTAAGAPMLGFLGTVIGGRTCGRCYRPVCLQLSGGPHQLGDELARIEVDGIHGPSQRTRRLTRRRTTAHSIIHHSTA